MARNYSNTAIDTVLTVGITAGDPTCVVASATGWPAVPFAAVLDPGSLTIEEVVQVTLKVGTTFTITRGFDGTAAAAHVLGAVVRHAAIAGDFTDLQAADATNAGALATHAALTSSAHGGIVVSTDPRLTDSRTPTAHAATHASAGSDPVTLVQSQVTSLVTDLAAKAGLITANVFTLEQQIGSISGGLMVGPIPTLLGAMPAAGNIVGAVDGSMRYRAYSSAGSVLWQSNLSRGTIAAPTISTSGDNSSYATNAYDGAANQQFATMIMAVDGTPAATNVPGRISFWTRPAGAGLAVVERARFTNAGALWLGKTSGGLTGAGDADIVGNVAVGGTLSLAGSALSANGRSLITAADYAAMKTLLGLVIGTNVQAWDADLDAIAALSTTSYGRSFLALADAAAGRALAGSAPLSATYITQTANSELSAEQALSSLATGYMKVTTATGAITSQATPIPAADGGALAIGRGKSAAATFYNIPGVPVFPAVATGGMTQNRDYYEPIWITTQQTFDRIAAEITTLGSAGSLLRLAIFNATVDLQPGSLVLDAGTVAADSTGLKEITISQVLPPGAYLLARNNNSTTGITLRIARGGGPGLNEALGSNMLVQNLYVARTFAAFPGTGTAWDTRDVTTSDFNHAIALRASAP